MSATDTKREARRRILAGPWVVYDGFDGWTRFAMRGDELELSAREEHRLESDGLLLPNRMPQVGLSSANRPGTNDMIELAKVLLARGGPEQAERVLEPELILPMEARQAVVSAVRELIATHRRARELA